MRGQEEELEGQDYREEGLWMLRLLTFGWKQSKKTG